VQDRDEPKEDMLAMKKRPVTGKVGAPKISRHNNLITS